MFILYSHFCIRIHICIRFGNTNKQPDEPMDNEYKNKDTKNKIVNRQTINGI